MSSSPGCNEMSFISALGVGFGVLGFGAVNVSG